ncbi:MAG: hypothetical protein JXK07_02070 [Spirochaetes bacterium]|nr:hypothetical protein [Spirochaetota bacterium]MBN2771839.1 hypothetical protein [Spirochaetota bacterium]
MKLIKPLFLQAIRLILLNAVIGTTIVLVSGCKNTDYHDFLTGGELLSFCFYPENNSFTYATIDAIIDNRQITAVVAHDTEFPLEAVAAYDITGYAFYLNGTLQKSGKTSNSFNESEPVTYTMYSYDGSSKDYDFVCKRSDAYFISFGFEPEQNGITQRAEAHISGNSAWFYITYLADIENLVPDFITSDLTTRVELDGRQQNSGTDTVNFSEPAVYRLFANDSSGKEYYFDCTISPLRISSLTFKGDNNSFNGDYRAKINDSQIIAAVPKNTDISQLVPSISYMGSNLLYNGSSIAEEGSTINCTTPGNLAVDSGTGFSHTYSLRVSDQGLICSAGDDRTITEPGTATLYGMAVSAISGNITYSWSTSNSNPVSLTLQNSSSLNPAFAVTEDTTEGNYSFTLQATNSAGDTVSDSVIITVDLAPRITINDLDTSGLNQISFGWSSASADFQSVTVECNGTAHDITDNMSGYTVSGLSASTEYDLIFTITDTSNNSTTEAITVTTGEISHLIYTAQDLNAVRGGVRTGWGLSHHYHVMRDIDLSTFPNWEPISKASDSYPLAPSTPFSGIISGRDKTISNLKITDNTSINNGLFAQTAAGSQIRDLHFINSYVSVNNSNTGVLAGVNEGTISGCTLTGGTVSGQATTGGLTGRNRGTITGCMVLTSQVSGTGTTIGSICGFNESGMIEYCHSEGSVNSTNNDTGGITGGNSGILRYNSSSCDVTSSGSTQNTGGIAGSNTGSIDYCFFNGHVSGRNNVGGLCGESGGNISNSFSRGTVSGADYVGGLVGSVQIPDTGDIYTTNCYAASAVTASSNAGGLIGQNQSIITGCCYDSELSRQNDTGKGTPMTTDQMKTQSNYSGWDFTTIWDINPAVNSGYPYLREIAP